MKKVLLASTALVLSAGVAAAEVSVSGSAGIWLQDDGVNDVMVNYDMEVSFSASGETDGGLTMGMDYTFLEDGSTDNTEVFISGAFGKLTVGDTDNAAQMVAGLGDIGYDGIGVDNVAEFGRGVGNASGVLYNYSAGDFGLYLSHSMDTGDDDVGVGVSAKFGDFKLGIGYLDTNGANVDLDGIAGNGPGGIDEEAAAGGITSVDLSGSFGDVSFDLFYIEHDLGDGHGATVSMGMGATTVTLGYGSNSVASDDAFGIGIAYDLGGAELAAGVGDVGGNTVWDLGVSMSF